MENKRLGNIVIFIIISFSHEDEDLQLRQKIAEVHNIKSSYEIQDYTRHL